MATAIGNLNSYSYSSVATSGKIYVPVSKSQLLYSHFDHVSGFVAHSGQQGVSVSKIQILNSLIDKVNSVSSTKMKPKTDAIEQLSDTQMDSLIKNLHGQLQTAMQIPYMLSGAKPAMGDLVSIQI